MKLNFQSPTHAVPEELWVDTGFGTQNNAFPNREAYTTANQVVRQLDHGPCSQFACIDNRIAECVKQGFHLFVNYGISRRQYLEASGRNPVCTNNQRRIHHPRSSQAELNCDPPYQIRAAAGKININTAIANSF